MSVSLNVDGQLFNYPEEQDQRWGAEATAWAVAISTAVAGRLKTSGGTMTGALVLAGAPTQDLHPATKKYVDDAMLGIRPKADVRVATVSAGVLASSFENGDSVDSITLVTGDRILVKNQADPTENGVYIVAASGAPARATDADTYAEFFQALVTVLEGSQNADSGWISTTTNVGTLGTDPVVFAQFPTAVAVLVDGQGIEKAGSTLTLELDGPTLSKSASGLKVATGGIADAQVATGADIQRGKLLPGSTNRMLGTNGSGVITDLAAIAGSRILISDANGLATGNAALTNSRLMRSGSGGLPESNDALTPSRILLADSSGWPVSRAALTANRIVLSGSDGLLAPAASQSANRFLITDASGFPVSRAALTASRLVQSASDGLLAVLAAITANRALRSDSSGFPIASSRPIAM